MKYIIPNENKTQFFSDLYSYTRQNLFTQTNYYISGTEPNRQIIDERQITAGHLVWRS